MLTVTLTGTSSDDFDLSSPRRTHRNDSARASMPTVPALSATANVSAAPVEQIQRLSLSSDGCRDSQDFSKRTMLSTEHLQKHGVRLAVQASTSGFRESLIKDMQDMLVRAYKAADASPTASDPRTGLSKEICKKLLALYAKKHGQVFDMKLWDALNAAFLHEACDTPLPPDMAEDMVCMFEKRGHTMTHGTGFTGIGSKQSLQSILLAANGGGGTGIELVEEQECESVGHHGSRADEDHVRGGVAVTEEALGYHVPDLITAI